MSNFRFLHSEWKSIYTEAEEAERLTFTSPKACVIICRSALEKMVHWLYANDSTLHQPYDTRLAALIHEPDFKVILHPPMFREINLIRKFGNNAAHGRSILTEEALVAIKNLFRFTHHIASLYSEDTPEKVIFNESIIPKGDQQKERLEELRALEQQLNEQTQHAAQERKKLEIQAAEIASLRQQLDAQQAEIQERKAQREKALDLKNFVPPLISEQLTRKLFIDQSLKEAGWDNLRDGYELEYEVRGMPQSTNPSGTGYADYVLWGDDGKPLAVVEAKKTMADARKGKHQATLYADCLEIMHGQRPVIFYTNGFETFLWDDCFYHERQVQGFYTKNELQLTVDRRESRKDLRLYKVNEAIAGRYYQKEAIRRVAEAFVKEDNASVIRAGSRKALLVMATGSGKTRTSAAIVDMLTKCNWAKRILFLADRNALVTQAKNTFNEHLPHLSAIDLTKEKEDSGTRLVFSTYPTIINKIDSVKSNDDRFYGVGHFDLIIIDEAHRSVYQKYGALFEYFDAMLLGLTATPKKEIDRNTYGLFDIEEDNPTHAYELNQAVSDGFLVPPKGIPVPVRFLREGIKYHELSDREKEEYEEKYGDPTSGEAADHISSAALNSWLFNTDTVDQVLNHLMTHGIKVQGGDVLGKTIIFAKNHEHALFIEKRFNKNYPEYAGKFLRVIDNYETKAQDLLERFIDKNTEVYPQIAVSVDMMDTGVDAPRVVNLVFFKLVKSYTKFWQMIGRGTRLCPDLFGPDMHKEHFIIFDYCQNFEFFNENPEGVESNVAPGLTKRIFDLKIEIITAVRDKITTTTEEEEIANLYTAELIGQVQALDENRFRVKMELRHVKQFSDPSNWSSLNQGDLITLKSHISKLILPDKDDHELARRFDIVLLSLKLALLTSRDGRRYITKIVDIANQLLRVNVPEVKNHGPLLRNLLTEEFWNNVHVKRLEETRLAIRELMKYLESAPIKTIYTQFKDYIDLSAKDREAPLIKLSTTLKPYRDRVESYIRKNQHHLVIHKLRMNQVITGDELVMLENMLFDGDERGTKEEFVNAYGEQPLGVFIRSIVGLDVKAANTAFAEFMQRGNLRADQMTFIKSIISFLERNGTIDNRMLFDSPFTDINDQGLIGVFDDADARKVIRILDQINQNAVVA